MRPFKSLVLGLFADHMTNVGRKYRSMTYIPCTSPQARTHTHAHALASHFGLEVCCCCNRIVLEIACMRLPPTSKEALKFQSILRSEADGRRAGCTQSAEERRLTCFPLQNPHRGGLSDSEENQHLHCARKSSEKKTKKQKNPKLFNRRHIFHGHN